jgi:hypothetical protein
MLFGMLAAAVGRIEESRRRRIGAAEGLIVARRDDDSGADLPTGPPALVPGCLEPAFTRFR